MPKTDKADQIEQMLSELRMAERLCLECGKSLTPKQQATGIHWCNPKST